MITDSGVVGDHIVHVLGQWWYQLVLRIKEIYVPDFGLKSYIPFLKFRFSLLWLLLYVAKGLSSNHGQLEYFRNSVEILSLCELKRRGEITYHGRMFWMLMINANYLTDFNQYYCQAAKVKPDQCLSC